MGQTPSRGITTVAEQGATGTWALLKGFSDDGDPISIFEHSRAIGDVAQRQLVESGLQVRTVGGFFFGLTFAAKRNCYLLLQRLTRTFT
jgi:hypothetical protein